MYVINKSSRSKVTRRSSGGGGGNRSSPCGLSLYVSLCPLSLRMEGLNDGCKERSSPIYKRPPSLLKWAQAATKDKTHNKQDEDFPALGAAEVHRLLYRCQQSINVLRHTYLTYIHTHLPILPTYIQYGCIYLT